MPRLTVKLATAVATAALGLAAVHPVSAHVVKPFGTLTVALGWVNEPAYVGFDNAVQVLVKDASGKPVTDITDKDLTVEVSLGSSKMDAQPLVPSADPDTGLGIPGEYEMHFIPTAPGNYTFHIKGSIAGTPVDETATASDKTFATVDNPSDVEFPNKIPTSSDLATRISQITPRINAVDTSAKQSSSNADDDATHALVVGIVALVVALIAILVAALRRRGAEE